MKLIANTANATGQIWTSTVSPKTVRGSSTRASPRRSTRITSRYFAQNEQVKTDDESAEDSALEPPLKRRRRGDETSGRQIKVEFEEKSVIRNTIPMKPRRQPAKKAKTPSGEISISPPTNWEQVYNLTKEMRKEGGRAFPAAVDTMGCERLADPNMSARDQRFQTLISLMLSSQTKDTVTAAAIAGLQSNLSGGLTLESILDVDPVHLDVLIGKVGFHNNKTKFIKQSAVILRDQFNSDIPDTITGLTSLPGVGPKMAYLCMSAAWGRDEGIGVDVHVHRITNLWGWHKTKNPEETRAMLEGWLPKDKWHEINHLLVGLGQTICKPVGRLCGDCRLAEEGLCPGSLVRRKVERRVKEEVKVEDGGIEVKQEVEVKREEVTSGDPIADIEDGGMLRR